MTSSRTIIFCDGYADRVATKLDSLPGPGVAFGSVLPANRGPLTEMDCMAVRSSVNTTQEAIAKIVFGDD
jgi:hypothetical protein